MSSNGLCRTSSANPSVSALGVFVGTGKPPIRLLASLHCTCREVRRSFLDSVALQRLPTGSLITSSHKSPRLAASVSAPQDAHHKLLHALDASQLDVAIEELKKLQTSGVSVEPHSVEQLIEGAVCSHGLFALHLRHAYQHTKQPMFGYSSAQAAELPVCYSSIQVFTAERPTAIPLLHISVFGHGSHQGMLFFNIMKLRINSIETATQSWSGC